MFQNIKLFANIPSFQLNVGNHTCRWEIASLHELLSSEKREMSQVAKMTNVSRKNRCGYIFIMGLILFRRGSGFGARKGPFAW